MKTGMFDGITRELGAVSTRRGFVRLFGGVAAMGAVVVATQAEPAAAKRKRRKGNNKRKKQAICQSGKQFGSVSVPATGATVTTPVLLQGQRYRLRATGFWLSNQTHGQDAFADFEIAAPTKFITTFQGVRLGLSVDGGNTDLWGSYNTNHVYEREVVGQGAALSLRCSDVVHADNSGAVLVEILCA